jgi:hypothetical protein
MQAKLDRAVAVEELLVGRFGGCWKIKVGGGSSSGLAAVQGKFQQMVGRLLP